MTYFQFETYINEINKWVVDTNSFDIGIFKIWIKFETFITELFIMYCIGVPSETGYLPKRQIEFKDEELLNTMLRSKTNQHIDYKDKIETISPYIFVKNPFDVILNDSVHREVYTNVFAIRNYVAHESGKAKTQYINAVFSGNKSKFLEPNEYLLQKRKNDKRTNYTYYMESMLDIAKLMISELD